MNYINTLREGDNVSEIYFCKTKIVAQAKTGKTYYSLQLQDKTGTIDAKIWDLSNDISGLGCQIVSASREGENKHGCKSKSQTDNSGKRG